MRYRVQIRKPLTEEAAKQQVTDLDGYRKQGHTPEAVITHAIGKSWQGLEAAKALMPFTHGKIAEQGKKGAKQEAANKAATGGRPVGRCQFGQCSVLPRIASSAVE